MKFAIVADTQYLAALKKQIEVDGNECLLSKDVLLESPEDLDVLIGQGTSHIHDLLGCPAVRRWGISQVFAKIDRDFLRSFNVPIVEVAPFTTQDQAKTILSGSKNFRLVDPDEIVFDENSHLASFIEQKNIHSGILEESVSGVKVSFGIYYTSGVPIKIPIVNIEDEGSYLTFFDRSREPRIYQKFLKKLEYVIGLSPLSHGYLNCRVTIKAPGDEILTDISNQIEYLYGFLKLIKGSASTFFDNISAGEVGFVPGDLDYCYTYLFKNHRASPIYVDEKITIRPDIYGNTIEVHGLGQTPEEAQKNAYENTKRIDFANKQRPVDKSRSFAKTIDHLKRNRYLNRAV